MRALNLQTDHVEIWSNGLPEKAPANLVQDYVDRSTDPNIMDRNLVNVVNPFLKIVRPTGGNGSALLILPGGGYRRLAWDKEGMEIASCFAMRGITACILAYRLPRDGWASGLAAPLADAQRAVRMLRHHADSLGIDPRRIAALGFSAGGHLCANLAARYDWQLYPPGDEADGQSARPSFAALLYPAIRLQLLASTMFEASYPDDALAQHSPHMHVPDGAPPHFIVHAEDDQLVPAEDSLALRSALLARDVPVETHLFPRGGHSFGLFRTKGLAVGMWPECLMSFGRTMGWA